MTPVLVGTKRSILVGVLVAAVYGVAMRAFIEYPIAGQAVLTVMTLDFMVLMPFVLGYLSVIPHPNPSLPYRIFVPWIPTALSVAALAVFGIEGIICIVMAAPVLILFASVGGLVAGFVRLRSARQVAALAALPLLVGPIEGRIGSPVDVRTVVSEITIAAPPSRVWREIVSVPPIAQEELPPALYTAIGFPRPVSATIDGAGVGAVRHARFEGGVLFLETVTDWKENELLSFSIAAQTDSIPATTLDEHVTIGGPYFDVLQGTYRLEPLAANATKLVLESRLRVSTHMNVYAGAWVDAIMRSIQETILVVEKRRAEAGPVVAARTREGGNR
jgi:hypothetical protein